MVDSASFVDAWHQAARTSVGLFWSAFWAFGLGYLVSAIVQTFVSRERMRRHLGEASLKTVSLGALFGFASSSCSFAALSTTRALFAKGAALVPSLAFLLASTNLVVELGVVIAMFLSWQFVVGEYVGGALLIALVWWWSAWRAATGSTASSATPDSTRATQRRRTITITVGRVTTRSAVAGRRRSPASATAT